MAMIKDLAQVNAELQEQKERIDTVDFKMVTFSLAGKDYGVDIMNVKEIAKADKFTFVPNAASFVRGVYNLRGDIIPIIDLRMFFHLPVERRNDNLENMLILRIDDRVYGTIVDKIDKVVGINTENIQPPHPIFGDINIKFISGVVEKAGTLYIILDVIRIFTQSEEDKQKPRGAITEPSGDNTFYPSPAGADAGFEDRTKAAESALSFIKESLPALAQFYPSSVNDAWLKKRYAEWSATRSGADLQLKNKDDAEAFLSTYYSPDSGRFWADDYATMVKSALPNLTSNNIQVWNVGCGKGYETFSFVCILKSRYPDGHIKVWANDSDIMAISQAPNLVFDLADLPEYCRPFAVKGRNGYSFNQEIKDAIIFEYHDVLHDNPLPDLDMILIRDTLSFLSLQDQTKVANSFKEKLKAKGIVIMGKSEVMPGSDWQSIGKEAVAVFMHNA